MIGWCCSKCGFTHNSEKLMIHHQITKHKAIYSEEKLASIGYDRWLKKTGKRKRVKQEVLILNSHGRRVKQKK